ncbi:hypothetical protein Tco_0281926 [Tanacetum coccineum]
MMSFEGAVLYDAYLEKLHSINGYIAGEELSDLNLLIKASQANPYGDKTRSQSVEYLIAKPLSKRAKAGKGFLLLNPSLEGLEEAILKKVCIESLNRCIPNSKGFLSSCGFLGTNMRNFNHLPEVPGNGIRESRVRNKQPRLSGSDTESDGRMLQWVEVVIRGRPDLGYRDEASWIKPWYLDEGQAGSGPGTRDEASITVDGQVIQKENCLALTGQFSLHISPKISAFGGSIFLNDKPSVRSDNERQQLTLRLNQCHPFIFGKDTSIPLIDPKNDDSVKEVVSSSVKHAMRAPIRARFKDLPTSDMKEILLQRMLEENYDKGNAEHRIAYEALQAQSIGDEDESLMI